MCWWWWPTAYLPPPVLALPRLGCVNIHGSLLPRWRGAAPIQRAILAGDVETGVTIMQLDAGLDTGPMLLERRRPIGSHDTAGDLHDALSELGAAALIEALDGLAAGTLAAAPQPPRARPTRRRSKNPRRRSTGARVPFELDPQVRAFNPWPMAETRSRVRRCACCAPASPTPRGRSRARHLVGIAEDGLRVACGRACSRCASCSAPASGPYPRAISPTQCGSTGLRFGA